MWGLHYQLPDSVHYTNLFQTNRKYTHNSLNAMVALVVNIMIEMKNITISNKSWSFHGHRIQWNFLAQPAASLCEGFLKFQELTPSPFPGCAGGLIAPKLKSFGATKAPAHPEVGDIVSSQNIAKPSHNNVAVCVRKFFITSNNTGTIVIWNTPHYMSLSDVVVINLSSNIVLTSNGQFLDCATIAWGE